jgi:hypothetical protein
MRYGNLPATAAIPMPPLPCGVVPAPELALPVARSAVRRISRRRPPLHSHPRSTCCLDRTVVQMTTLARQAAQVNTRWLSTAAIDRHRGLDGTRHGARHCAEQTSRLAVPCVEGSPAGYHTFEPGFRLVRA